MIVPDIAIFVLKRDVKLQLTNFKFMKHRNQNRPTLTLFPGRMS